MQSIDNYKKSHESLKNISFQDLITNICYNIYLFNNIYTKLRFSKIIKLREIVKKNRTSVENFFMNIPLNTIHECNQYNTDLLKPFVIRNIKDNILPDSKKIAKQIHTHLIKWIDDDIYNFSIDFSQICIDFQYIGIVFKSLEKIIKYPYVYLKIVNLLLA